MLPRTALAAAALALVLPATLVAHHESAEPAPLAADTPSATARGNTFVAPEGWTLTTQGDLTIVAAPEGDSWIALVDVPESAAKDAEAAVAAAWKAYKPGAQWPILNSQDRPDRNGWSRVKAFLYQVSPNERRSVAAFPRWANGIWTVALFDVADATGEKRGAQVGVIFDRLFPKGYSRESFAGKTAHPLDAARLAELARFVEEGRKATKVPGIALGIVQGGKVVYAGGFGERQLGSGEPVDADTTFMIASNTKALTTLLLAKLVEEGKLAWDTPVTSVLPSFALGDAETTKRVLVRHLICACTGLPRQDLEWIFEYGNLTSEGAMRTLATMQPTSEFGALFQYSNPMAGAAGFTAGHVLYPDVELGAAYDRAMQSYVFDPLGMTATTFDTAKATARNSSGAFAPDIDGRPAVALTAVNSSVFPLRPAGAAWSNVRDMLRYVQMELDEGMVPGGAGGDGGGHRYIAKEPLLERRKPQVALGADSWYGMGLMVDQTYGVPVVHHGGDLIGFHSDMLWLPAQNVGAVILTNGDPGWIVRGNFGRKLLEVLFDGKPEADARDTSAAASFYDQLATDRKLLTVPADPAASAALATSYSNGPLGGLSVAKSGNETIFDFGEWKSPVATRANPDGTLSFVTTAPGMSGFEFVAGTANGKRTLVTRDAQHEYVFEQR